MYTSALFILCTKYGFILMKIYFNQFRVNSLIVCTHLRKSSCMRDTELTYTLLVYRLMKYPTFKDMKLC